MASASTVEIAREVRRTLSGQALTAPQAKLYSQRLRRDMGQAGLASFAPSDIDIYIDEAMLLLQCALLERRADPGSAWREGVKRAAEILEWLSQSSLKPPGAPLHLLSAAAYQLAGYPAMALGHLRHIPDNEPFSKILWDFLRADFPAALDSVSNFWRTRHTLEIEGRTDPDDLTQQTFQHVIMCVSTICSYLRTGTDVANERALTKLEKLADSLLYSRDPYSYLLAELTAVSCRRFVESCLWPHINRLRNVSSESAGTALIQFAKTAFINRRALVWPAQAVGIERLQSNNSFVLCTPTGSGKTTIATLAIVQGLFAEQPEGGPEADNLGLGNLVLYLVPSRALAAEVESRLAQDLNRIAAEPIVVTGLYGGIDWGPTDAWIQTDGPTIVICTYEKADALLRYLGILFLNRVRVVVIDEVHMVDQDEARLAGLVDGSSRSYRLEQLGSRLLRARNDNQFRVIALSAVATRAAPALARWINGASNASPVTSTYRSTRQMLGRLEVSANGQYTIRYNLMDGRSLRFEDERRQDTPFVPSPFPPIPGGIRLEDGPEVRMRGPTLWAALHLAAERHDGTRPSVMISITQFIDAFAKTCADLVALWPQDNLPNYWAVTEADDLWNRCLASAADYFTTDSVEYRLLQRGIAVHHGKMPGLLARRLKTAIDRGFVRVIIATSTLSEGVNIPVNYLLIPSVYRGTSRLSLQEFTNLIGRAGRPGTATEGNALVVLPERTFRSRRDGSLEAIPNRQWDGYESLITELEEATTAAVADAPEDEASSPLSHLLESLETAWNELTGGGASEEFATWLEQTAIIGTLEGTNPAFDCLDSLDSFLIAAIQEVEELRRKELTADEIEAELTAIWRQTYAFAAAQDEARLAQIWLMRGRAIKELYPDRVQRRHIYRTSLPPRSATTLIDLARAIRIRFQDGTAYAHWTPEERFNFIREIILLLSQVRPFRIGTTLGRRRDFQDWPRLLRWWLAKTTLAVQPAPSEITNWYEFVSQNFIYRAAWGLGSVIGLLLDGDEGERSVSALELDDWPRSGLPWIAFWLKDLITWGTLDPVAAFLLARGDAVDRPQAEAEARSYYEIWPEEADPNEILDPRQIRDWLGRRRIHQDESDSGSEIELDAVLVRPPEDYLFPDLLVTPIEVDAGLLWIDPAGYTVARSEKPHQWTEEFSLFEFKLYVFENKIIGHLYLQYR